MIDVLMEKLLEEPVVDNNEIVFTSRAVELIHEISEKCKGIQIVEQTREQTEEYAKDLSAEQVYVDMLCKIVDAPTTLHMKCSVRMLIPIIDRKLRERGLRWIERKQRNFLEIFLCQINLEDLESIGRVKSVLIRGPQKENLKELTLCSLFLLDNVPYLKSKKEYSFVMK